MLPELIVFVGLVHGFNCSVVDMLQLPQSIYERQSWWNYDRNWLILLPFGDFGEAKMWLINEITGIIWHCIALKGSTFIYIFFNIRLTDKFPWRFSCCQTQRLFNVRLISCGTTWAGCFLHCQSKSAIKHEAHIIITFLLLWTHKTRLLFFF